MRMVYLRLVAVLIAAAAFTQSQWLLWRLAAPEAAVRWIAVALVLIVISIPRRRSKPAATRPRAAGLASSQRAVE